MTRYFKLGGLLLAMAALFYVNHLRADNRRLSAVEASSKACEARAGDDGPSELDALKVCPQNLSDAVTRSRRYQLCDAGLAAADLYRVRAGCSEAVKRRDAEATAATAEAASLNTALADLRAGQAAAIARAAARAATSARKEANADSALARAPKVSSGGLSADRLRCDDDCLRALTGQ